MSFDQQKWTLLLCFLIHVLFLLSIFDIYFQSPIVEGIVPMKNNIEAPAKRLVLFIGDGVRSDICYTTKGNRTAIPYIRRMIEHGARWGISHTRVPTESRPGHIALIAGFYEDPSAIFKGWKENPIKFDSVFNESVMTFAWGGPDVVSIFSKEQDSGSNYVKDTYPSAWEDFSGAAEIVRYSSTWTGERFKKMIEGAKHNGTLRKMLHQEKIIFFFHLLGIDTSGHAHKPHSEEYFQNILIADGIAQDVEHTINDFFNDSSTAFIFTSDHGMTDWGSHGEGSVEETEVPFVAWGAGISRSHLVNKDSRTPADWNLNHILRNDINQADIAPLISVLLGISIPVNSVGKLPVNILDLSLASKSAAILLNCHQIMNQFAQKKKIVEQRTLKLLYRPYKNLVGTNDEILSSLYTLWDQKLYNEVITLSLERISEALTGLDYYHNYYQRLLLTCISAAYIGWIALLILYVCDNESYYAGISSKALQMSRTILNLTFKASIAITLLLLIVQSLPFQYYFYCCLPLVIWWNVLHKLLAFRLNSFRDKFIFASLGTFLVSAIGTEIIVIAFFDRRALSLIISFMLFWPLSRKRNNLDLILLVAWRISCIALMIFPFLQIMKSNANDFFIIVSCVLSLISIILAWRYLTKLEFSMFHSKPKRVFLIPFMTTIIAAGNVLSVSANFSRGKQLSVISQLISWSILFVVPLTPLFFSKKLLLRLLNIYFCLNVLSLLFTLTYEALFIPLFSLNLFLWLMIETHHSTSLVVDKTFGRMQLFCYSFNRQNDKNNRKLSANDFRLAFFFFFYMVFSFFGTGNLASINSFDTGWVRCFITIFSPFTMFSLILVKIIIPFVITACTFRAISVLTKVPVDKIFFLVLIYCELMGLNFLFLVKNVGSWLEIGSSVSHYVISQTIIMFIMLIYSFSAFFTSSKIKLLKLMFSSKTDYNTRHMQ